MSIVESMRWAEIGNIEVGGKDRQCYKSSSVIGSQVMESLRESDDANSTTPQSQVAAATTTTAV
jgi:hypothetical protein